jgi:hypothetical protein
MNKLNKILDYIYAPLIKMVNKNNNKPTTNIEDRSFFQIFMVLASVGSVFGWIAASYFTKEIFIYSNASETIAQGLTSSIVTGTGVINIYFSFGFAYYYHITFKNYMKFLGRQILDWTLSSLVSLAITAAGGYMVDKYNFNFTSIMGFLLVICGIIFAIYRIIMIVIYHNYVTYSTYYLSKYSDVNEIENTNE